MASHKALDEVRSRASHLLLNSRQDRYESDAWITELAESVQDSFPVSVIMQYGTEALLKQAEKAHVQKANGFFRQMYEPGGQLTFDWVLYSDYPITIRRETEDKEGNLREAQEKVCLRAVSPDDLIGWARYERKRAKEDFDARIEKCENAERLAREMRDAGDSRFDSYAEKVAPVESAA